MVGLTRSDDGATPVCYDIAAERMDSYAADVASQLAQLRQEISNIVLNGLPSSIDCGTF